MTRRLPPFFHRRQKKFYCILAELGNLKSFGPCYFFQIFFPLAATLDFYQILVYQGKSYIQCCSCAFETKSFRLVSKKYLNKKQRRYRRSRRQPLFSAAANKIFFIAFLTE